MIGKKIDYKKLFLLVIIVFFSVIFFIKFSLNYVENKVGSILKSQRFETFLMNEFNNKLENFANKEITKSEYIFYKENLKKIYVRYRPIFKEIEEEIENK